MNNTILLDFGSKLETISLKDLVLIRPRQLHSLSMQRKGRVPKAFLTFSEKFLVRPLRNLEPQWGQRNFATGIPYSLNR